MIKAVFFDWFNTLARYEPPREELHSQALKEFGIEVSPQQIMPGLLLADRDFFAENVRSPVQKRDPEEQAAVFTRYQNTVLTEAGVKVDPGLLVQIMQKVQQLSVGMTFTLFDDVLSTLKTLKAQGFILGLLTNYNKDMNPICYELGLEPWLDFVVTSGEVGSDKPNPPIFLAALQRAGVSAAEAVHVGDQYQVDVVGARGVGIRPILIDRYNFYPEVSDCPRISRLAEIVGHLN